MANKQEITIRKNTKPVKSSANTSKRKDDSIWVDAEIIEKPKKKNQKDDGFNFNILTSVLVLILTIISLGVIIAYIWLTVFNTKPTTTFTAQINTIGSEDKDYFMEFNQLRGNVGKGQVLNELKLNYYSSETLSTRFSSGMQTVGPISTKTEKYQENGWWIFSSEWRYKYTLTTPTFYYNEDANKHAYTAIEKLSTLDYFVLEINESIYQIEFEENILNQDKTLWINKNTISDPSSLFVYLSSSVYSLDTGDYVINFPLGNFFGIKKWNVESGQFEKLDVQSKNKLYVEVKVHIDDRGVVNHSQSIFDVVAFDPDFNIDGIEEKEYWKAQPVIVLTDKHFEDSNSDGYISLNKNLINYLNYYTDVYVYVDLNLDNIEGAKGFDYYGLLGIELENIKLSSTKLIDFEIKNLALKNTGIEVNEIITKNVNVVEV